MDKTPDMDLEPTQQGVSGKKVRKTRKKNRAKPRQKMEAASSGSFLANLKISRKLSLIVGAFTVPLLALLSLVVIEQNRSISTVAAKQRGLEYLLPLERVLEAVPLHRDLSIRLSSGDSSLAAQRETIAAEVRDALAALAATEERYGGGFDTSEYVTELTNDWQALEARVPAMNPDTAFQEHSALIVERVFPLLEQVGDRSGLGLDSDLSNFYLSKLTLETLPSISESLSQLRDQGSGILTRQTITAQERQLLSTLVAQIESDFATLRRDVEIASEAQPAYAAALEQNLAEFESLTNYTVALTRYNIVNRFNTGVKPATFFGEATRSVDAGFDFLNTSVAALTSNLNARSASLRFNRLLVLGSVLLGLALSTFLVVWIARRITRSVNELATVAERVGRGDLSSLAKVDSNDEIGTLARIFNNTIARLRGAIQTEAERDEERRQREALQQNVSAFLDVAMNIADGDFTQRGQVSEDVLGNIVDAINLMVEEVSYLLGQTRDAALSVNNGASEMIATSEEIAQSAQRQAAEAERARSETEQVTASIRMMAQQADESANASTRALEASRQGETAVQNTLQGMEGIRTEVGSIAERTKSLTRRSDEISGIVRSISRIASQTNLLALSASLEAAGAGEAGVRFGTVASEVQALAEDSASAARQVAGIIRELQSEISEVATLTENGSQEVETGYRVASEAGQRLREIAEISGQSAELARRISEATQQQVQGVEGVNEVVQAMAEISQASQGSVSQGRDTAERLQALAAQLSDSLSRFRLSA